VKTVKTYDSLIEAQLDSSLLESAGIPTFISDAHTVGSNLLGGVLLGGLKLQVPPGYEQEAKELLANREPRTEKPEPTVPEACPYCGFASLEVEPAKLPLLKRLLQVVLMISLNFNLGDPSDRMVCRVCKKSWKL